MIASLAMMVVPASSMAAAQFTIDEYRITSGLQVPPAAPYLLPPFAGNTAIPDPPAGPSSLQANGNPSAGTFSSFNWSSTPGATDDVKKAVVNFGAGLLGNPLARPTCSQAVLAAGGKGCPAESVLGTARFDIGAAANGATVLQLPGTVYNSEPDPGHPGQLGIVIVRNTADFSASPPPAASYIYNKVPFSVTSRGNGDYGLTGVLDDITRPPTLPGPTSTVATGLSFLVNSATGFIRNPTSCVQNTSTGYAVGYDNPEQVDGPAYNFTPTGCDAVPFAPSVEMQVGDTGSTATQKYPPLVVKIKNQNGHADIKGNTILLPEELNVNNPAYKLCTQAQADSNSCPANSQFGGATAKSPFLSQSLSGPVYLVQQTSSSLPGLLIDLKGLADVKIQTATTLVNNRRIQSVVTNAPQLPVSELTVALNGGKSTGVFQNRSSLCFSGSSSSKFKNVSSPVTFQGWNGANTSATVDVAAQGCGPGVSGKLRRPQNSNRSLSLSVNKHPNAQNVKELLVTVPKKMRLVKKRFAKGTRGKASANLTTGQLRYRSGRTFTVRNLPSKGDAKFSLTLKKGAFRFTSKGMRSLNRGRTLKLKIKVKDTPVSGKAVSTTTTVKAKGKRKRK